MNDQDALKGGGIRLPLLLRANKQANAGKPSAPPQNLDDIISSLIQDRGPPLLPLPPFPAIGQAIDFAVIIHFPSPPSGPFTTLFPLMTPPPP